MISVLRNRFGIPGAISVIALIFALTGSAYAAKYFITSTSQIKPSVLKKLKGAKGPKGATGAAGLQGPGGPAGKEGPQGKQGIDGEPGQDGSPWTVGNVLPKGAMQTGDWAVTGNYPGLSLVMAPISFPIPLSTADAAAISETEIDEEEVTYPNLHVLAVGEDETTDCPGTLGNPEAAPGKLCIYPARLSGYFIPPLVLTAAEAAVGITASSRGVDTSGAIIFGLREAGEGPVEGIGTWALTAPEE